METQQTLFDLMTAPVRPAKTYHNTTKLSGPELKARKLKAASQNEAILQFFQRYPHRDFIPFEVWDAMKLPNTPLTSIRRAISDLTKQGFLVNTKNKRMGNYGEMCYTWKLK